MVAAAVAGRASVFAAAGTFDRDRRVQVSCVKNGCDADERSSLLDGVSCNATSSFNSSFRS